MDKALPPTVTGAGISRRVARRSCYCSEFQRRVLLAEYGIPRERLVSFIFALILIIVGE